MGQTILLGGRRVELINNCGKGGEAEIYRIDGEYCFKLYKSPSHPDFQGDMNGQRGARERLEEHQTKLPGLVALAPKMPSSVIMPLDVGRSTIDNSIVGFKMKFVAKSMRFMDMCDSNSLLFGYDFNRRFKICEKIFRTTQEVHKLGGVFGDFNDLGVVVSGDEPYILDADAMQIVINGKLYICKVYQDMFVDPLICDPNGKFPMMVEGNMHSKNTDWYAAEVMLFRACTFIGPYDGTFRPKDRGRACKDGQRPLRAISVFDPEVSYPDEDVATPLKVFPDELLARWEATFRKQQRGEFPLAILQNIRWTNCTQCGKSHGRPVCPHCSQPNPIMVKQKMVQRGKVTVTETLHTSGKILHAVVQRGKLVVLSLEGKNVKRSDTGHEFALPFDQTTRLRIQGDNTIATTGGRMVVVTPTGIEKPLFIDLFGNRSMVDANSTRRYWAADSYLWKDSEFGPVQVGQVIQNHTLFWVGESFGFGFFLDGPVFNPFIFGDQMSGIMDGLKIPRITGNLRDAHCVFGKNACWYFTTTQEGGKTKHAWYVIRIDGQVTASINSDQTDEPWLAAYSSACAFDTGGGAVAVKNMLFVATDGGIVRLSAENGSVVSKEYPDTAPFVNSATKLLFSQGTLLAVREREVTTISIRDN